MAFRVRDRDAPITKEGIIFRVMGYNHLPNACFCDVEYAPNTIYHSSDPRSVRQSTTEIYHKFYADGGLTFIRKYYPDYQVEYPPLTQKLVGLYANQILTTKRPNEELLNLLGKAPKDELIQATQDLIQLILDHSHLRKRDFGVFGSLFHNFHNPNYSDIDLIVYGRKALKRLRETLHELYDSPESRLENEFPNHYHPRNWRFTRFTLDEFKQATTQKLIYGIYDSKALKRKVKVEFEPVRRWEEIHTETEHLQQIKDIGWTRLEAEVIDSQDSGFMPSIYAISPIKFHARKITPTPERIVSYVEEFRLQAEKGDKVIVEGPVEQISTPDGVRTQVMLSYNTQYYTQVLQKL